ncbi:MAG: cytochrome c oxidase accessory protein CcoG [Archangiaceae bacterium]|nr:cytochrome c oxidase accessory protein CcoG [Archangiaceae bacterium]
MTPTPQTPDEPHLPFHVPASTLGTMKADGSRIKMHPADVKGKWLNRRRVVFALLVAFYVITPLVKIGGKPAIQLDVAARKFYLFGATFNAQDFWMVLLLVIGFAFGLLALTAWRGRVWCGWACPQTVFLEGVYRPIEHFFEGGREQRIKLDAAPWSGKKIALRLGKYATFLFVSLNIAHAAAAIFVGPREFLAMITEGPSLHPTAFFLVMGFTAILMFNFTWFREQFCVVLCPYGRLQSVLHDKESITVSYFEKRGEPRGKVAKGAAATPRGDCVDCNRCVAVCPTGIDIRNGLQMECLACLQCVDACNDVMSKVKRPPELIGFASHQQLIGQPRKVVRPRLLVYLALMVLSLGTLGVSLVTRTPFESNVIRTKGSNPFIVDGDVVRNPFEVHLVNKNPERSKFHLRLTAPVPADVVIGTPEFELASLTDQRVPVMVTIKKDQIKGALELTLEITDDYSGTVKRQPIRFLSPMGVGR